MAVPSIETHDHLQSGADEHPARLREEEEPRPAFVRRSCRTSMSSTLRLKRNSDGPRTGSVAQYGRANRAIWDPKVALGVVKRRRVAPGGVGWRLLDVVVRQTPPLIEFGWEFRVQPQGSDSIHRCASPLDPGLRARRGAGPPHPGLGQASRPAASGRRHCGKYSYSRSGRGNPTKAILPEERGRSANLPLSLISSRPGDP